jgi:hypothetical protein
MKTSFASWLLAGGLLLGFAVIAPAQDRSSAPSSNNTPMSSSNDYNTATDNTYNAGAPNGSNPAPQTSAPAANTSNSKVRTLSGCLREGAGANEYALYGNNANSWEVVSNNVDLAAHVGQAVEVAYVPRSANGSNGANKPLVVTGLVMISSSCAE